MSIERGPLSAEKIIVSQVFEAINTRFRIDRWDLREDHRGKLAPVKRVAAYLLLEAGLSEEKVGEYMRRSPRTIADDLRRINKQFDEDRAFAVSIYELGSQVDIIRARRDFVRMRRDMSFKT